MTVCECSRMGSYSFHVYKYSFVFIPMHTVGCVRRVSGRLCLLTSTTKYKSTAEGVRSVTWSCDSMPANTQNY